MKDKNFTRISGCGGIEIHKSLLSESENKSINSQTKLKEFYQNRGLQKDATPEQKLELIAGLFRLTEAEKNKASLPELEIKYLEKNVLPKQ